MIRRAVAALALLALLAALPGCTGDSKQETCEAEGGTWVSHTILMPVLVGKTTVLMPQKVWSCVDGIDR